MLFPKRGPPVVDPDAFAITLAARLQEAIDTDRLSPEIEIPLPGNPWARRLVVALDGHTRRQRWVAQVVRVHLRVDPLRIAEGGAWEVPGDRRGQVPELPGWSYRFHGIGCCLTHEDGTTIDVDFDEHGGDGIDPYFYGRYLASLPAPGGVEALLRRAKPLDEWWMAELNTLRRLGWIEGNHRVRLTRLGARWATALRVALEIVAGSGDTTGRARAALLIGDFPWAAEVLPAQQSAEVRLRAGECAKLRASQLERELRSSRVRSALAAIAVLDPDRGAHCAENLLGHGPLDGLTSCGLAILLARPKASAPAILLGLAERARGPHPPEPYLRTMAIAAILKGYQAHSLPAGLRAQILDVLQPDAHASEGEAALLHVLVDPEAGLARLGRCLGHTVPNARAAAAAALALLGTPEAAAVLRSNGDRPEAAAALALLRGLPPDPGPTPEGTTILVRGVPRRVYATGEILAASCPGLVDFQLKSLSRELGPLLERWWAQ
jgi:hypothetical protein